jgi:hypothetical protein
MERADLTVTEILITDVKDAYIGSKGVRATDVFEVHGHEPLYFVRGSRTNMVGPNRQGRFLVVALAHVDKTVWRLITAYWNDDGRARRIYEEARR